MEEENVQEATLIEQVFKERKFSFLNLARLAVSGLAIYMSLFHIYTSFFGTLPSWQHRAVHVGTVLILVYCFYPFLKSKKWNLVLDGIPLVLSILITFYVLNNYPDVPLRGGAPILTDKILGMTLIVLVIEATRRVLGAAMSIIAVFFLAYIFMGPYFPGLLGHPGFSYSKMIDQMYISNNGVFGVPIYVSSTVLVLFIIFGAMLLRSGAGKAFIDFAYSLTGHRTGGPALTSVGSSALIGSITGNGVANVAITGTFTIPLMRRMGYNRNFSGAVEAVASQGGQILPPIMGAAAFMIAEYTGIPYIKVMGHALIPALFYFLTAGLMIYMQAQKEGLQGVPRHELPDWKKQLLKNGHLFIPIMVIIYVMLQGFSPMRAGFWGIISVLVLSMIKRETRMGIVDLLAALENGMKNVLVVASACACSGIIVGSIVLTGLGIRFSRFAIELGGGELVLVLIMMMIASLIMGMGMTTVSVYVILAVLGVPALVRLGVPPIGAHLFVFYFGIMSALTPPVALTAYSAAGVAGGDPQRTSFISFKLGLGGFIIPFMFIYNSTLLLLGSTVEIIIGVVTALIGCFAFASAIQNYLLFSPMQLWQRAVLFAAAILLIGVAGPLTFAGIALMAVVIALQFRRRSILSRTAAGSSPDI